MAADRLSPAEVRTRGNAAAAELTMTQEAFETVKQRLFQEWMDTKPSETDKRERLYHSLYVLASARAVLIETVNAGSLQKGSDAVAEILNGRDPVV